jgi:flagellar biosynthesis/type III secretory pathway protein FliH
MMATAEMIQQSVKPSREQFQDEESYVNALLDWKVTTGKTSEGPAVEPEKPNRLQTRFDKLTRTIHEQREHIEKLEKGEFEGALRAQRDEITRLKRQEGRLNDRVHRENRELVKRLERSVQAMKRHMEVCHRG